jgi:hypothetical protein
MVSPIGLPPQETGVSLMVYSKVLLPLVLCVTFCVNSGCSKNPSLGRVTGTVTFDGKPLEEGTIIFTVSGTRDASGLIKQGEIQQVTSFQPGDGAPMGEAKVSIIAVKRGGGSISQNDVSGVDSGNPAMSSGRSMMTTSEFLIPTRYTNPETSGLTATISNGVNEVRFDLTK